ncbi:hypothetical protein PMI07_006656 [Rhizobium sp. CF080]|uniref:YiiX/YebB-like N1pC/P60 family cysteine hydrolase n=1 Tax=Rhizobium sp. (strain CF080) TaxID=1144310 RepID=UPI0002715693|nr:YiiX/YebB-like N1pC/P60 family cysteine hydrolase [Rhizobium sp. CF080]EUB98342.1 hypothetical protein PMI07_006656 [Rhizobium sp. CF080]
MTLTTGDLVFACIGPMTDAISAVTRGYRGALLNHVGIAVENEKGLFVLEAFPPEVRVTNWEVCARRTLATAGGADRPYMVGRLRPPHRGLIPNAIQYGLKPRDVPYDRLYSTDQQALYCSELIVDMFAKANGDAPFFPERPMSFRDPATGEILRAWREYYQYFGMDVPDGEPGSNPADLSSDKRLEIISVVGSIPGLT